LLTKRTYIVPALIAAIAFPAAALAATGNNAAPRIGLANAKPVKVEALQRPVESFHRAIRTEVHKLQIERRARLRKQHREAFATLPGGVSLATLNAIAACESGGNPTAISSGGTYRGKYQFDYGTWESVGGHGDPAAAPEAEQDYRAALLYSRSGSSPWPVCG
jgi:soluble lytic murein transglycosylase-like protein